MGAVIGISGYSGSGKDYFSDDIIRLFPEYRFKKMYFAAHLKECAAKMLSLPVDMMYSQIGKQYKIKWLDNMTVREFLQKFGSDAIRNNVHADFWVRELMSRIGEDDNVLIPDMRFPNELEAVEKVGITVRIDRVTTVEKWNETSGLITIDPEKGRLISKLKYIELSKMMYGEDSSEAKVMTHISETALDGSLFTQRFARYDHQRLSLGPRFTKHIFNKGYIKF